MRPRDEHPVPCQQCGAARPRLTWNPSALCDVCEGVVLRRQAVDRLVESGYGPDVAFQIVGRLQPAPATWPASR